MQLEPCISIMRFSLVWLQMLETEAENVIHQASSQEMRNNRVRKSNFKLQRYIYRVFLIVFFFFFCRAFWHSWCSFFFLYFFFSQPTYGRRIRSLQSTVICDPFVNAGRGSLRRDERTCHCSVLLECCSCCQSHHGQTFGTNSLADERCAQHHVVPVAVWAMLTLWQCKALLGLLGSHVAT